MEILKLAVWNYIYLIEESECGAASCCAWFLIFVCHRSSPTGRDNNYVLMVIERRAGMVYFDWSLRFLPHLGNFVKIV